MKINKGFINGDTYTKEVSFKKAVLWMVKEISIHKDVAEKLIDEDIKWIEFIDRVKKEVWRAKAEKVKAVWKLKQFGQEPQYYIPIQVFDKLPIDK